MTTKPKGSEREVKAKYPDAHETGAVHIVIRRNNGTMLSKPFDCLAANPDYFKAKEAWADAAQRINAEPER